MGNDDFNIVNTIYFEDQDFNEFRVLDHEHVALWKRPMFNTRDTFSVNNNNFFVYQLNYSDAEKLQSNDDDLSDSDTMPDVNVMKKSLKKSKTIKFKEKLGKKIPNFIT